ncbi:hypothetical protein PG991_008718 [Apiospora marii]|uniref:Uncharacterized protein n=2 Tax=Apiospora marii TaxID=335849 RepID=A0ABR1RMW2_9PEZI
MIAAVDGATRDFALKNYYKARIPYFKLRKLSDEEREKFLSFDEWMEETQNVRFGGSMWQRDRTPRERYWHAYGLASLAEDTNRLIREAAPQEENEACGYMLMNPEEDIIALSHDISDEDNTERIVDSAGCDEFLWYITFPDLLAYQMALT